MREHPTPSPDAAGSGRRHGLQQRGAWPALRVSVATKFNLFCVSLLAVTALTLGGFVALQGLRSDRDAVLRFATAYARPVVERGQQAIHSGDPRALERLLERLLLIPDAAYVRVLDSEGTELIGEVREPGTAIPDPLREGRLPRAGPRITSLEEVDGRMHRDVLLPVAASGELLAGLEPGARVPNVIGWVQIGLDDRWARERRSSFLMATAALVSSLAIVAATATVLIVRWLVRPIHRLSEVAREVAEGHFDQRIDVHSRDEVGELGRSLDVMLERLREYRDQVEDYQRNLETQVDERTLALQNRTQEALELAKDAQAANRAKTQFLANISHEIRTPMNGVLGMTELLLDTELAPTQRRFAATVHKSARLLLGLINDLLDFSRAEAGRLKLEHSDFDPGEAIEDVADMLAEQAHARGIELACFVDEELPRIVRGDPVRLRQVLTNLVGNAIKFTDEGEVVVRAVRAAPGPEPDDARCHVQITVTDTGIGIPEAARESIFEAFQQADGSMARRFGGVGLGLAISKQLVELMGGSITFETDPSRGSRFSVALSFEPARESGALPEPRSLEGLPVLVADGHATSRRISSHRLRSWGAEVVEAADAEAAERSLAESDFRVVFLDPGTLGPGGAGLARRLAAGREGAPVPVILTPLGRNPGAGLDGRVVSAPKPTRERALWRSVSEALRPGAGLETEPLPPAAAPPAEGEPGPPRVLLVEDNEVNRQVAEAMLRTLGCELEMVADGRQAVARAVAGDFDLVFMDCQLPELDGFAATRAIREAEAAAGPERRRVPIVALTAHAMRHDRDQCLRSGMDDYVSKPFDREALVHQLEYWAPGRSLLRPSPPAQGAGGGSGGPLEPGALRSLRALEEQSAPDLVASVVEAYLVSSEQLERDLCDAAGGGDAGRLARAAHKLKSSSAQIGAERLSALCKELEALGRSGLTAGAEDLVSDVSRELAEVQEALAAERFGVFDD